MTVALILVIIVLLSSSSPLGCVHDPKIDDLLCSLLIIFPGLYVDRQDMPRWMNLVDTLMVATPAPNHRRLRIFHQAEDSLPMTVLVSIMVFLFFIGYVSALLLFFTAVFLFPFVMLGVCVVAACVAALGAKATYGSVLYVWHKVDKCTSSLLLGVNHANSAAQPGDDDHEYDDDV